MNIHEMKLQKDKKGRQFPDEFVSLFLFLF